MPQEQRAKASANARQKKFYHHMGPKTFEQKRVVWIKEGFYPTLPSSSSAASSSVVENVVVDRTADWYCSIHGLDVNGRRTISDPGKKKIADAVVS